MGLCTSIRGLKDKEVINLCDGRRLGYVVDAEIDVFSARVVALVVCLDDGRLFSFGKNQELVIPWDRIEKFGDDVILVNVIFDQCLSFCGREKQRPQNRCDCKK